MLPMVSDRRLERHLERLFRVRVAAPEHGPKEIQAGATIDVLRATQRRVRVMKSYVKSKSRGSPNGFLGDAPFQLDASKNAAWTRTPNPRHVGVQVQTARRYETVHGRRPNSIFCVSSKAHLDTAT